MRSVTKAVDVFFERMWTSALACISRDKIPPPGLEPGLLRWEPSILTSWTIVDSDEAVVQCAILPSGGWQGLPLVSHPPSAEHGLIAATYSHREHALQRLPHSNNACERMQAGRLCRGWQFVRSGSLE